MFLSNSGLYLFRVHVYTCIYVILCLYCYTQKGFICNKDYCKDIIIFSHRDKSAARCGTVIALIFSFNYPPENQNLGQISIHANKFFHNFHLSESSFTRPRLRANSAKTSSWMQHWLASILGHYSYVLFLIRSISMHQCNINGIRGAFRLKLLT